MAIPSTNYIFDETNSLITTENQGTWADKSGVAWDDWTSWADDPVTPLTWVSQPIDLGEAKYFNINWTITCAGVPTYTVFTSSTGAFAGEETSATVNVNDTNVEAFFGRFVLIFVSLAHSPAEGFPTITAFDFETTGKPLELNQFDLNSSTLTGSSSARAIVMPRTVSKVLSIQLTAHTSEYVEESYVASSYIDNTAPGFPAIVSKTRTGPTVTFISTTGAKVDAVFDVKMNVLPEQFMNERNLTFR